jgi:hypothetical protein
MNSPSSPPSTAMTRGSKPPSTALTSLGRPKTSKPTSRPTSAGHTRPLAMSVATSAALPPSLYGHRPRSPPRSAKSPRPTFHSPFVVNAGPSRSMMGHALPAAPPFDFALPSSGTMTVSQAQAARRALSPPTSARGTSTHTPALGSASATAPAAKPTLPPLPSPAASSPPYSSTVRSPGQQPQPEEAVKAAAAARGGSDVSFAAGTQAYVKSLRSASPPHRTPVSARGERTFRERGDRDHPATAMPVPVGGTGLTPRTTPRVGERDSGAGVGTKGPGSSAENTMASFFATTPSLSSNVSR